MQLRLNQLATQCDNGLPPFVLIFGDEPQQTIQALDTVREHALKAGFAERQSLTADADFDWSTLLEATQTMSLFSDKQLIELHLPTGKPGKEGSKALLSIAEQPSADMLIVIYGPRVGKDVQNTKWFKTYQSAGWFIPCFALEGRDLENWVAQLLQQIPIHTTQDCIAFVADACEGNMLAAKQEIDKLGLLYAGGTLNIKQCKAAVVEQSRYTVYQLIDTMLAGDAQRIVKLLFRLESEGLEPNIIIWALIKEWETLYTIDQLQRNGERINWTALRVWGNKQGLYTDLLKQFTPQKFASIRAALKEADFQFKNTQPTRPYVLLCHLCLLFTPYGLDEFTLSYA